MPPEPDIPTLLRSGAMIILGVGNLQTAAELCKESEGLFVIPRDNAVELSLPEVTMAWCILLFRCVLPNTLPDRSDSGVKKWMRNTFGVVTVSDGRVVPEETHMHDEGTKTATVILNWNRPVHSKWCAGVARSLERACLLAGGSMKESA